MSGTELTPRTFDRLALQQGQSSPRILWTAASIGHRIGTSADFVRDTLAKQPGSPVKQIGGRYCAVEADLIAFFRPDAA